MSGRSLLAALRQELITQGLARDPNVAGTAPPMWLEPLNGVPAPGQGKVGEVGDPLVLGAFLAPGVPSRPYESPWRRDHVDVWFRGRKSTDCLDAEPPIRAALIDKRAWTMGGTLTIIESGEWRALQPLARDEYGYTYIAAYWFQTYAAS